VGTGYLLFRRENKPPKPMTWLHSDVEGCVGVMAQNSIMTVKLKQDGERELTIVDPAEHYDDSVNCDLDDCEDSVDNEDDTPEHDDTMLLGLLGCINMMTFDD
jgi:hypothetical protein